MPKKNLIPIELPVEQPDCCATCKLVGLIPKGNRQGKYTHVCCATAEALTRRGIKVKASEKDSKHPLKRPCDAWYRNFVETNPKRIWGLPRDRYFLWRVPYENEYELQIKFPKR